MALPEQHKYPFDITGESRDNYVYPETREVTKTTRVIIPKEGGFFTKSMRITFNGTLLKPKIDYKPVFLFEKASVKTNKEVCAGIRILNDKVIGEITLGYQVVGGFASEYPQTLHLLMEFINSRSDAIPFDQLINLPEKFMPCQHMHHVGDLIGMEPAIFELQGIKQAIENLRSHRNVALYRLIGSIHTRVNNFIETYTVTDTSIRDSIADLKERVGKIPLVNQDQFIETKRALDKRIDDLGTSTQTTLSQMADSINDAKNKMAAFESSFSDIRETQTRTKKLLDEMDVTARYTGGRTDGQFITVARRGSTWIIEQNDPSYLTSILTRLQGVESSNTSQDALLTAHSQKLNEIGLKLPTYEGYDQRITNIANQLPTLQSTLSTLSNNLETHKSNTANNFTLVNQRIDDNVQKTSAINLRLNTAETKLDTLTTINNRLDTLTAQGTTFNQSLSDLSNKANQLDSARLAHDNKLVEHTTKLNKDREDIDGLLPLKEEVKTAKETIVANEAKSTSTEDALMETVKLLDEQRFKEALQYSGHYIPLTGGARRRPLGALSSTERGKARVVSEDSSDAVKGVVGDSVDVIIDKYNQTGFAAFAQTKIGTSQTYSSIAYPYSRFQRLEVGVDVQIREQGTKVTLIADCLSSDLKTSITASHVSFDKNRKVGVVRKTTNPDKTITVEVATAMTPNVSDKFLLFVLKPSNTQQLEGREHVAFYSVAKTDLTVNSPTSVTVPANDFLERVVGEDIEAVFTEIEAKTLSAKEVGYSNGDWQRLTFFVEPGWWCSDSMVDYDTEANHQAFYGTSFIRPGLKIVTTNPQAVAFNNFYVRPVEEQVTAEKLPGINDYLKRWFGRALQEQQTLPQDSRWDLSRYRIQPGAENFSSVEVDENDNLNIKGVVYYDAVGQGKRGVFAPTSEITITEAKTWKIPKEMDGRVALVTVRANSRNDVGKVIHSCVRQMMVTLTGETEIPIKVGDISSFGTHVTVSNAVDYPDAIVGRIESPAGSNLIPGLVSVKV